MLKKLKLEEINMTRKEITHTCTHTCTHMHMHIKKQNFTPRDLKKLHQGYKVSMRSEQDFTQTRNLNILVLHNR